MTDDEHEYPALQDLLWAGAKRQPFWRTAPPAFLECLECGARTEHGKPYCPAHVLEMPYIKALLGRFHS